VRCIASVKTSTREILLIVDARDVGTRLAVAADHRVFQLAALKGLKFGAPREVRKIPRKKKFGGGFVHAAKLTAKYRSNVIVVLLHLRHSVG